jgi:alpha-glucosidase (family GH31 glycosyl hydrolase)
MFGDNILVAPVLHESRAQCYLPEGTWTDFWSNETVTGPKWVIKEDYPLDLIPVYVRENSVLLLGPEGIDVPDYKYGEVELEARSYQVKEDVTVDVPVGVGKAWAGKITVGPHGISDKGGFKVELK